MEKAMDKGRLARMLGAGVIIIALEVAGIYIVKGISENKSTYQTTETRNNSENQMYDLRKNN
jgi:flagellar biogenesis protein FliO